MKVEIYILISEVDGEGANKGKCEVYVSVNIHTLSMCKIFSVR